MTNIGYFLLKLNAWLHIEATADGFFFKVATKAFCLQLATLSTSKFELLRCLELC